MRKGDIPVAPSRCQRAARVPPFRRGWTLRWQRGRSLL